VSDPAPDSLTVIAAVHQGVRDGARGPVFVLGASYVGFGSLIHQSEIDLAVGVISTLFAWALPGQVTMVEMHSAGASLLAIFLAVSLSNVRLMAMVVAILPLLASSRAPRYLLWIAAFFVAVTGWAMAMMRCPNLPAPARLPYFLGAAVTLWAASLVGVVVGFHLAGRVPQSVSLGLVFLNPVYFMLVFLAGPADRRRMLALASGAACSIPAHLIDPGWGLLMAGIGGGTLAWAIDRPRRPHG
jgi:predicted branched-subunit amino acid permease